MMTEQQKQKIILDIKTEYDQELAQEEYNRLIGERKKYLDKGFSESQAKHFNRNNENIARQLENGFIDCLFIDVVANVLMPCGHYEKFRDGLGGCFVRNRSDIVEVIKWHNMIENVKDAISKHGINADFEICDEWKYEF